MVSPDIPRYPPDIPRYPPDIPDIPFGSELRAELLVPNGARSKEQGRESIPDTNRSREKKK
jgi:hypothetical protein